jgi:hypothetical protein
MNMVENTYVFDNNRGLSHSDSNQIHIIIFVYFNGSLFLYKNSTIKRSNFDGINQSLKFSTR